jgi:hypothetical protein
MQKSIDRLDLQIKSAIALEHLKNYIYVEAEKEAHVKEVIICLSFLFLLSWISAELCLCRLAKVYETFMLQQK